MRHLLIVAAGLGLVQGSLGAELAPDRIYPEGSRFSLVLYSIHTVEEMNGSAIQRQHQRFS